MGATKLRYASEGPFVQNEEGGPATPGEGFQNRRVSIVGISVAALSTALNTVPLTVTVPTLEGVNLNLRYRAELLCWLTKTPAWTSTGTVTYTFEYSADAGVTYTSWANQSVVYGGEAAHDMSENVTEKIETIAELASGWTGVEAGDDISVRVVASLNGGVDDAIIFASPVGVQVTLIEEL